MNGIRKSIDNVKCDLFVFWRDRKKRYNCLIAALLVVTAYVALSGVVYIIGSGIDAFFVALAVVVAAVAILWCIFVFAASRLFKPKACASGLLPEAPARYESLVRSFRTFQYNTRGMDASGVKNNVEVFSEVFKITFPEVNGGKEGYLVEVCHDGRIYKVGYFRQDPQNEMRVEHLEISSKHTFEEVEDIAFKILQRYADTNAEVQNNI